MRQKQNRDGRRVERVNRREQSKDQSRRTTRTDQRRKQREQSAGRDENRATAETKAERRLDETRLETEMQSESERTRAMTIKRLSSCGALCYIERAQGLPSCSTWRVISTSTPTGAVRCTRLAPLSQLTRAARTLLNKMHACDNTAYIIYMYLYIYSYTRIDGSHVSIFTYY